MISPIPVPVAWTNLFSQHHQDKKIFIHSKKNYSNDKHQFIEFG